MAKNTNKRIVWWVEHPAHTAAVVEAPDWELATVEAAKWWDVPWRKVAAECSCQKKLELPRFVCADCGATFFGREGNRTRCAMCAAKARDYEANKKAAGKRFWNEVNRGLAAREGDGSD